MRKLNKLVLVLLACGAALLSSCKDDEPVLSSEAQIKSFDFADLQVKGAISGTNITAEVKFGTNVSALVPTIVISKGATITPSASLARDFSEPVKYTVLAEDQKNQCSLYCDCQGVGPQGGCDFCF